MSDNSFAKRLETQGIPESLYKLPLSSNSEKEESNALNLISEICLIFPFHESSPPQLSEFFISHIVIII